ncbi:hypothetical protein FB440_104265 [Vibrio crassostreae]|nr:hypothetical protein FB440_104265 [Vibrio crassostreae]
MFRHNNDTSTSQPHHHIDQTRSLANAGYRLCISVGFTAVLCRCGLCEKPRLGSPTWLYLPSPPPLNDIDVIYFDPIDTSYESDLRYEALLKQRLPELNWQVRNQACMHIRNGDEPYQGSLDAMSYWPEKETAVAIKQGLTGDIECNSAFGLESLFDLKVTPNPKRNRDIFDQRVQSKGWLTQWPKLTISHR